MDLAIRIEMYKNFAIMPLENPLLRDIACIKEAVIEKEASEEDKVSVKKEMQYAGYRKIYMQN